MQLAFLIDYLSPPVLAWGLPGGYEWIVIGALGLLIFGKRLPGAARGIGQSILEFKRGMNSKADDVVDDEPARIEAGKSASKPRFDPQTGKPLDQDHAAV